MKKALKVFQQEPELEPPLTQAPPLQVQEGFSRKPLFYPNFKFSFQSDLQFANQRNIHFKRTRVTEDFKSPSYKRLIKRNLKYIKRSELCTFGSRPSIYLLQKLNQHERNQQCFPKMARDMICLFRFLLQNNISIQSLKLLNHFAHDKRKYMKYLTGKITSLKIKHNGHDVDLDQVYYHSITPFGQLKRISLDFTHSTSKNAHTQSFLCDIIKMLSQIPTLKAIEITMNLNEVEKKVQKLKAFTEKLAELKSLKLNLTFSSELADPKKLFTTLLPLITLKHLSINLLESKRSIDCTDLEDFIGSMKNPETLEFTCKYLLFHEKLKIFQAIQKLKSLTKLSVDVDGQFAFGTLFKTLNTLKKLVSIKIDLHCSFDNNELNSYPQHLLKHPALKRAKIALDVYTQRFDLNLTDEFFANLHRLRDRLDKFHLKLYYFPVETQREIKKIIIGRSENDLERFSCQAGERSIL